MTAIEWRRPNIQEEMLIRRLLAQRFQGQEALALQFATALVRVIDNDGSLEFRVSRDDRAPVVRRIPIEAEATDQDGIVIHALLHVVDGKLKELEFYKDDSSPIRRLPPTEKWQTIDLP